MTHKNEPLKGPKLLMCRRLALKSLVALLSFTVEEARYFNDGNERHLALFTRRLDNLAISEDVLGRVHIGDNTAQVLLSNIAGASTDSLPAIRYGALQTKLMPQGMTDASVSNSSSKS